MAAITTQRNGNWSDTVAETTPWTGGVAPTSGDTVVISHAVTIDDSAPATITVGTDTTTAAINIASGGTLQYLSTASASHVLELRGDLIVASGGTLSIGTSANPIPVARSFVLELNKDGADGDYGLIIQAGSTCNLQGGSLSYDRCLVNSNITALDDHFHSDVSTAWKSGDTIAFAPTTRTYSQFESFTLDGDASGTTITLPSGSSFAYEHSGTSPTQGEVINLTRNVRVTSDSTSAVGYVYCGTTATIDCDWVEFSYLGEDATNKYALQIDTTTGSSNFNRCSVHDTEDRGIAVNGTAHNNWIVTNCVCYRLSTVLNASAITIAVTSGTNWELSHTISIGNGSAGSSSRNIYIADVLGNVHSITASGSSVAGIYVTQAGDSPDTWDDWVSHSNGGIGIDLNSLATCDMTGLVSWRNGSYGLVLNSSNSRLNIFRDAILFGNSAGSGQNISMGTGNRAVFHNLTSDSDSTYATRSAFVISGGCKLTIYNSNISQGTSPKTAHTNFIELPGAAYNCVVEIYNTTDSSTNRFDSQAYMSPASRVSFHNYLNVAGRYRTCKPYGDITDVVTGGQTAAWCRGGAGQCVYLNPTSTTAGQTLEWTFYIPVTASTSTQLSFYHKETSASFNGSLSVTVYDSDDDTTLLLDAEAISSFSTDWASYTSTAFVPTHTGFCRVVVQVLNGSTSADVGIDDVSVV